jgi:anti-sigma B factor antagonist
MSGGNAACGDRLRVAISYCGDVVQIVLAGELDLESIPRFEGLVASAVMRADRCRIDLSGLTFVDSSGVRALLRARRRASESGATLELVDASPAVARVLSEAGVEHAPGEP